MTKWWVLELIDNYEGNDVQELRNLIAQRAEQDLADSRTSQFHGSDIEAIQFITAVPSWLVKARGKQPLVAHSVVLSGEFCIAIEEGGDDA